MKKMKYLILMLLLLNTSIVFTQSRNNEQQTVNLVPFSKGVTFSGWFEFVPNAQTISFGRYTEQDFRYVKNLGVDVIRLPIDFTVFTSGAPNYIIDPHLFRLLDQAIDWAEKYQIYIILDNHPINPPTDSKITDLLIPVWRQITERYKNRSEYVIYEILNDFQHLFFSNH
jgi:endoglucanase